MPFLFYWVGIQFLNKAGAELFVIVKQRFHI
jgi:hypothetical protein